MYQPVAIIGISFELPDIKNWEQLAILLQGKAVKVQPLSPERLRDIRDHFGSVEMAEGGYLDRIDLFDNDYFDFTRRESVKLFPEHRIFLMNAIRAFYDAGYNEEQLKGTNTGVFLSRAAIPQYLNFLKDQWDFIDLLPGIEGTHLATFLDLRGPVITIDTACSSSLVAIHKACLSLESKECDLVLAGGVKIGPITRERQEKTVVISSTGVCRAFDNNADGMMNGEGTVCMVLKRLEDARRDQDPIYGLIRGSAVNHGGGRISSLTAPSAEAQKEVILAAWDNAKIDPVEVRFIEAHGSGTILGDPIEIHGIQEAFQDKQATEGVCSISAIKDQIGHLDIMAGSAGLLRLIAAMHNRVIPAQANLQTINELVNEADGVVRVQREPEPWKTKTGNRLGGVSSFGLTGTNVHLVFSSPEVTRTGKAGPGLQFLQLSATSLSRLDNLKQYFHRFIETHPDINLYKFSHKVNRLFRSSGEREGLLFSGREQLLAALSQSQPKLRKPSKVLLMDLDLLEYSKEKACSILDENLLIKAQWNRYLKAFPSPVDIDNPKVLSVLLQYVLYRYLIELLRDELQIVTRQGGGLMQQLLQGKLKPDVLHSNPELIKENSNTFNFEKFRQYLNDTFSEQKTLILTFIKDSHQKQLPERTNTVLIAGSFEPEERYTFYREAIAGDHFPLRMANLPEIMPELNLPIFQKQRFWPEATVSDNKVEVFKASAKAESLQPTTSTYKAEAVKEKISLVWNDVLEIDEEIGDEDDFFNLGGDSLSALDMLSDVEREFRGVKISYEQMFRYNTIAKLSEFILEQLQQKALTKAVPSAENEIEDNARRAENYERLVKELEEVELPAIELGKVFVTGATGLVGAQLVMQLARKTNSELICLIRPEAGKQASERFWRSFHLNFKENYQHRISIIEGDLEDKNFYQPYATLLQEVHTVFHIAGSPDFVARVGPEEHINYIGTKHVVDWANAIHGIRYFYLISTIGMIGKRLPNGINNFYETDLDIGQETGDLIHVSSKMLAEKYVHEKLNHITGIFRIPNVGGRVKDGAIAADLNRNLMYLRLRSLLQLKCYSEEVLDHRPGILLTPVDILTNVIISLAKTNTGPLQTYHLNFEKGFTIREIISACKRQGINFRKVSHESFIKQLEDPHRTSKHNFNRYRIEMANSGRKHFHLQNKGTSKLIDKLNISSLKNYNRLEYLEKTIAYCSSQGFLTTSDSEVLLKRE